jgi:uncharacterized protein YndB with AHSA1/START domain
VPRVTRRRTIAASPDRVWELIADPYNLPRWWPRTARVENVAPGGGGDGLEWTQVLTTEDGRGVRADFRLLAGNDPRRYAWEQLIPGTPFARHLRRSVVEIELGPEGEGTEVAITMDRSLRGLSRLGGTMMRRGQGATLEEALEGIERTLAGGTG